MFFCLHVILQSNRTHTVRHSTRRMTLQRIPTIIPLQSQTVEERGCVFVSSIASAAQWNSVVPNAS